MLNFLIINPNTTTSMTESIRESLHKTLKDQVGADRVRWDYFTALPSDTDPGAISSINSPTDAEHSAAYVFPHIQPKISTYDAFLVACFSEHPLVGLIQSEIDAGGHSGKKFVTGIFEASIISCQNITPPDEAFGIVTTGQIWEEALSSAVGRLDIGLREGAFAGVQTTGLTATELHDLPPEEVFRKITEATGRFLAIPSVTVKTVCMGCAGMVGFEDAVREGLGPLYKNKVKVVDGVVEGIFQLMEKLGGFPKY
jgi:Asp/Glu/hydantoin racemase